MVRLGIVESQSPRSTICTVVEGLAHSNLLSASSISRTGAAGGLWGVDRLHHTSDLEVERLVGLLV